MFYSLTLDQYYSLTLLVLTDRMSYLAGEEVAAIIADYAASKATDETIKSRIRLDQRVNLERLKLLSLPSGKVSDLSLEELEHSQDLVIDSEGFKQILAKHVRSNTMEQAFDAACLLVGVRAGLMIPKNGAPNDISFEDCFDQKAFEKCDFYDHFLASEKLEIEL